MRRIAIVGAGLAAVSTCDALRSGGYDGELVLFSAEEGLPYDRPPLSKDVLLGKARREDIMLRPAEWYEQQGVELWPGTTVSGIRPAEGAVELSGGSVVSADRIVLATGGTPRALPVPGGDDPAVHLLRTWEESERLRERLLPGARVAVVGAGLIGAETAAVAGALGCRVTLIDPVPVPLVAAVGSEIAEALHQRHTAEGIRVVTGGVERIERRPGVDEVVLHVTGLAEPLPADTVVVGIGIRPATALAEAAGLKVDNGIVVDHEQRASQPNVFAVGDVARRDGHAVRHEHWDAAQRGGQAAAAGLLGRPVPAEQALWFWSDRHGSRLEAVGTMADADRTVLRGSPDGGAFTAFGLRADRLVAAAAIDRGRDIKAAQRLIDRGVAVDATRLADESADLRTLLRG
ncbi:NAD(P)/FAD-dependent oxidoreductase [Streptomyces himalayensis]|uniref:FAD-dependent oxidoreductase n=1 Tax=Streptomyces himalayensis subsp. himalayensis TaxID=2756131 RepID=A0A7W0IBR0_9ACTN|nr:FAD-dependent oxidoreductase [Streptomyces himalayensis]MBA2949414.1 FAD-dependent oxidoreductase [Streptomyces himalayensis subsp. himalayensis]